LFERYTDKARRVIFFARYEASEFRSPFIDTEHVLLGVVREDEILRSRLLPGASHESLRKQIEALSLSPGIREPVPTSVDLPLSEEAQRALIYASQEAEALQHQLIDCGHLILGLLRVEGCLAAAFLGEQGITYEDYREVIRTSGMAAPGLPAGVRSHQERPSERPSAWDEEEETEPSTVALRPSIDALKQLVDRAIEHLDTESPTYGRQRLKRKPWTRQEAPGPSD
jgi:ATP-dependent Clp protease ATP-binding subunit ClpC